MKQWYQKKYFNKMYWIFEELENLNLTHTEICFILLIQYFNETNTKINFEEIKNKMKMDDEQIDELLDRLNQKGYLSLSVDANGFNVNIDGLFAMENEVHFESNIFDLFESEFKRPISSVELRRISDWLNKYDEKEIMFALREASLRNIFSFDYINRILENGELNEEK